MSTDTRDLGRHNICGSKPKIPDGMSGTLEPLTPEFFVNPRCPLVTVPVGAAVAPKAGVREEVERPPTAEAKVGDNPDSPSKVAEKGEDLGVPGES